MPKLLFLPFFLALSFLPSLTGVFFRPGPWYEKLRKPSWNPPEWLFGPVWTFLYASMGVAAWLVWERDGWIAGMWLFLAQLGFNGLWMWLFFGLRSPALSFLDNIALWLAITGTIAAFWRVHAAAGALLLPCLLWVTFAAVLNLKIWRLNPHSI
ncbi:MAG TPA: TspO/MBR family protein [Chthoniobacteraceae bacterium]|jgi:tryptophan-rich sensory protein|nr:TspO/MBR family protein [Chthoniobacteraceae bacterium]